MYIDEVHILYGYKEKNVVYLKKWQIYTFKEKGNYPILLKYHQISLDTDESYENMDKKMLI